MYILNKGNVVKVDIVGQDETHKIVKIIYNGKKKRISNKSIYETKDEAKLAIKEIKIKRDFKKKHSNRDGLQICKGCGCIGTHTLDHKKPLTGFGGKENIRKNKDIWKLAWQNSNLQILCKNVMNLKVMEIIIHSKKM